MRSYLPLVLLVGCGFTANGTIDAAPHAGDGSGTDAPMSDGQAIDGQPIDASVDGAPDAPPDATPVLTVVEALTVSCRGATVTSGTVLQAGQTYHLRVSGTCIANTQNNSGADADYVGYNISTGPLDSVNGTDCGVAVNDSNTSAATKQPHWGSYTGTHIYEVSWTGAGGTIGVNYHADNLTNNAGTLTFQILAFE